MGTAVVKNLTIKEMQDYYDHVHGARGTYINRGGFESWNLEIKRGEVKLPPEFACVSDGQVLTWDDVKKYRRQRQKEILIQKRMGYRQNTEKKPLYVWVFWCPGISSFFRGLWTYFVGFGRDYRGGGYKGDVSGRLLEQVIKLFPLVERDLFGELNYELWQRKFIEKYKRGLWCGKPQGKALIWAEVKGGEVMKILGKVGRND